MSLGTTGNVMAGASRSWRNLWLDAGFHADLVKMLTAGTWPEFPLPEGAFFGPRSGPAQSVSGYTGGAARESLALWQSVVASQGRAIDADGLYGDVTRRVVMDFQRARGLPATGMIDRLTWDAAWQALAASFERGGNRAPDHAASDNTEDCSACGRLGHAMSLFCGWCGAERKSAPDLEFVDHWHAAGGPYAEYCGKVAQGDRAIIGDAMTGPVVMDAPVQALLRSGCVHGLGSREGLLVVAVDPVGLLATGHLDLLVRSPRADWDTATRAREAAEQILVTGWPRAASPAAMLDRVLFAAGAIYWDTFTHDAEHIQLLLVLGLLGNREAARHLAARSEAATRQPSSLVVLAAFRLMADGDRDTAIELLTKAEQHCWSDADWLGVARAWRRLVNLDDAVRRCLSRAEEATVRGRLSQEGRPWVRLAAAWADLAADTDAGRRALSEAERVADASHSDLWLWIAATWSTVFHDRPRAVSALMQAEAQATQPYPFYKVACADAWYAILGDSASARRVLERAADLGSAEGPSIACDRDWLAGAAVWRALGDSSTSSSWLTHAEAALDERHGIEMTLRLAEAWLSLGSMSSAARCLGRAEAKARSISDLVETARRWEMLPEGTASARRCLSTAIERFHPVAHGGLLTASRVCGANQFEIRNLIHAMESQASDSEQLVQCARAWVYAGGDPIAASRCLAGAEAHARGMSSSAHVATTRAIVLGDSAPSRTALVSCEKTARDANDWRLLAAAWLDLEDGTAARRCLVRAEAVAATSTEWTDIASGWMDFDVAQADRCLLRAEREARTTEDFFFLACRWCDIETAERHGVTRCISLAEGVCGTWKDWDRVAGMWRYLLADSEGEQRCNRKKDELLSSPVRRFGNWLGSRLK